MEEPNRAGFPRRLIRSRQTHRESRRVRRVLGYMRIVVLLSDAYRGAGFTECYAIDPVAGTEMDVSVNLPDFTAKDIEDIYKRRRVDYEVCRKALEPLIESYVETSRKRETLRVVGEAVDYARENCGAKPGEPMTGGAASSLHGPRSGATNAVPATPVGDARFRAEHRPDVSARLKAGVRGRASCGIAPFEGLGVGHLRETEGKKE